MLNLIHHTSFFQVIVNLLLKFCQRIFNEFYFLHTFSNIFFLTENFFRSLMFLKIRILKNFAIFTRKHLCWSLFLMNFQALKQQVFYRATQVPASVLILLFVFIVNVSNVIYGVLLPFTYF